MVRERVSATEIFIPVFFLALIALIAMLMYGDASTVLENRILLTAFALVAAVLFQFSLNSNLPPHGYLTFADKLMIVTYGIMIIGLLIGIMLLNWHHKRDIARSNLIQFYSIRIVPILAIIVYVLTFWLLV